MPRAYDLLIRVRDGKNVAGPFSLHKAEAFIAALNDGSDIVIEEAEYPRAGRDLQVSFVQKEAEAK
jgi:hypothetical protein